MQTTELKTADAPPCPVEVSASGPVSATGPQDRKRSLRQWGRRLGVAGFFFFLFKGLLWLIIPAWIVVERGCAGQ